MPASNHVSTAKLLLIFLLINILLITEVSSSCQCNGYYEPLIINVQASQLTASGSHIQANLQPWCSKSNMVGWHSDYYGVCDESLYGFWIEVDFLENKLLAGIVTWGRATMLDQFVTSFHLEFLVDKSTEWTNVTENGTTVALLCAVWILANAFAGAGFQSGCNGLDETRLSLHGRSIACDRRHVTVGMEKNCTQYAANEIRYDMCVIEGTNEDGRCQVLCRMKDSQTFVDIRQEASEGMLRSDLLCHFLLDVNAGLVTSRDSITLVKQGFAPAGLALCGLDPRKCFRWSRIPIRVQWSGFRTRKNETRLSLHGRSIACDRRYVTVGMEKNCTQCAANEIRYDLCAIEGTTEDGRCQVLCRMKESQVGQPINLTLMVNGNEDTELCAIASDASLTIGAPGRTLVHDWPSFLEKIRDV
ncbi:hypothetical protein CAPTEDRAFT_212946 [Capitella teleta]|uniref:F5/8 type C domain-containing protein n=1 Tax=Capitella teleta TaxID=283909 RepID=R7TE93_CAPTE|nr:hypothetical protein CAPTEDRAFT_212946 [Capitella teleta]|eukprot:ELT92054.1 hypothetical protein CAPTEDRAFT_212946 [Capitella teleta]